MLSLPVVLIRLQQLISIHRVVLHDFLVPLWRRLLAFWLFYGDYLAGFGPIEEIHETVCLFILLVSLQLLSVLLVINHWLLWVEARLQGFLGST